MTTVLPLCRNARLCLGLILGCVLLPCAWANESNTVLSVDEPSTNDVPHLYAITGDSTNQTAMFGDPSGPFADYDKKIIRAVEGRWHDLIKRFQISNVPCKVTVKFEITSDGRVEDERVLENTMGDDSKSGRALELFCEKAIAESAPFEPLPADLRKRVASGLRDATFAFYY